MENFAGFYDDDLDVRTLWFTLCDCCSSSQGTDKPTDDDDVYLHGEWRMCFFRRQHLFTASAYNSSFKFFPFFIASTASSRKSLHARGQNGWGQAESHNEKREHEVVVSEAENKRWWQGILIID